MDISIDIIRELCNNRAMIWTGHIIRRLRERVITMDDVRNCLMTGDIIEQYPGDYPYPSCLISGKTVSGKALHIVAGIGQGRLWCITAYFPSEEKWNAGDVRRKER